MQMRSNFNGADVIYAKLHKGYFHPEFGPVNETLDANEVGGKIRQMTKVDGGIICKGVKSAKIYNFYIPDTNLVGLTFSPSVFNEPTNS